MLSFRPDGKQEIVQSGDAHCGQSCWLCFSKSLQNSQIGRQVEQSVRQGAQSINVAIPADGPPKGKKNKKGKKKWMKCKSLWMLYLSKADRYRSDVV